MSVQIITSRHTVNRLSDFQLDMVLEKDGVLYMPASFVMAFYVDEWSCEDAYVASRLDGQTTNCEISGSIISVYFNSPGFTCGQLKCRVIDSVDNAAFTDGTLDTCTPLTLPVEIVATAGDSEVISLYTDGYQPPATGIPKGDLEQSVQDTLDSVANKVDKEAGKGLSTEDFTAALKAKLETLDPYTKAEVDDKVANAGKVKSVSVNGTNHTPNSSGVVDLGTIQGTKGDKGEKGDTVVIDPEGLAQFEIANDLDTSDPTQGLSARQGKILKQAISTVQANLQAVVDALANMAFTSAKPTLSQIDWTGGTFYATIVKSLTGCTATDNTNNGQIAEGQSLTMQLTADSGFTLTGAAISVTNSKGQSVVYSLNGSTLTVANVTGTITVSVVAVGVFSVSLGSGSSNIAFASGTSTETTSGSSWTGTIEAASGYKLPASITVTMGGNPVTPTYNSTTGSITIANVTGNIVITAVAILDIGNVMFDNVRILGGGDGQGFALVGPHEEACITPLIEVPSGSSIEFNNGGTDGKNPLTFYDENGDYVDFFSNNAAPRTVNMVTGAKYIRLSVPKANLSAAYIKVDNNVVWSYDNDTMLSYEMFLNSSYCPQPNARGDHEGCLPWMSYTGLNTPVANSLTNARQTTNATLRILLPKNGARDISAWPYVFCKMVEIPSDKEISFKTGELTGSDKLPYLQLYQKSDGEELKRSFYDLAASSSGVDAETMVRQVKVPNEYTHCSLVAKYDTYKNGEAYIKATSTNETLWSNK